MPLLDPIFPAKAELPGCARELMAALYPTIRLEKVSFHPALPATIQRVTDIAITLPDPLALRHIRIFVAEKKWDTRSMEWLGIIVHECFHVLQYEDDLGGFGLGPIRIFPMKYLGSLVMGEGGERGNRYEKPAYQQEERFLKAAKGLALCGDAGLDRAALGELLRRDPGLVRRSARE